MYVFCSTETSVAPRPIAFDGRARGLVSRVVVPPPRETWTPADNPRNVRKEVRLLYAGHRIKHTSPWRACSACSACLSRRPKATHGGPVIVLFAWTEAHPEGDTATGRTGARAWIPQRSWAGTSSTADYPIPAQGTRVSHNKHTNTPLAIICMIVHIAPVIRELLLCNEISLPLYTPLYPLIDISCTVDSAFLTSVRRTEVPWNIMSSRLNVFNVFNASFFVFT